MLPFPCMKNAPINVCLYTRSAHGVLHVYTIRKWAARAHACRKNLWTPATISLWLFAHFFTRKHAASVGLRHACMNVSTYTTLSLLLCMFPCCKSRRNISSRSCHCALWPALRSCICGRDSRMNVYSYTYAC